MSRKNTIVARIDPKLHEMRKKVAANNDLRLKDVDKELAKIAERMNNTKVRREIKF